MRGLIGVWHEHFGVGIIVADDGREYSIRAADLPSTSDKWPTKLGQRVEFKAVAGSAKNVERLT